MAGKGSAEHMGISLLLGSDDFGKMRDEGKYYIDKTGIIEALLNERNEVTLLTRPRRFGKTLTMTMLEDYFQIGLDSRSHFEGLKITANHEFCEKWMNQWPTVFLTLKSVVGNEFQVAFERFKILIAEIFRAHDYLAQSTAVNSADVVDFLSIRDRKASYALTTNSLKLLTRMMEAHYGKKVIVLIDEYDVPLAKAYEQGYYDEMLDAIRILLGESLKTNPSLKFAVITGCLRVSKESIFTGLNNLVNESIHAGSLGKYIGFTQSEVIKLLRDADIAEHFEEIKEWYDGYNFGGTEMYCPWDVLNHVKALQENPCAEPRAYWINTSENAIIKNFLKHANRTTKADIERVINGGAVFKPVREQLTYH